MVMQSPPSTFYCRSCGWKKTLPRPIGDCRIPGHNHFTACPQCGAKGAVHARPADPVEVIGAHIKGILRR